MVEECGSQDEKKKELRCEFCGSVAVVNTPRLDGDIVHKPYIDLCEWCDRRYQELFWE